jgi:hypothetical protein
MYTLYGKYNFKTTLLVLVLVDSYSCFMDFNFFLTLFWIYSNPNSILGQRKIKKIYT